MYLTKANYYYYYRFCNIFVLKLLDYFCLDYLSHFLLNACEIIFITVEEDMNEVFGVLMMFYVYDNTNLNSVMLFV